LERDRLIVGSDQAEMGDVVTGTAGDGDPDRDGFGIPGNCVGRKESDGADERGHEGS
jgi:hypothetical protein